MIFFWIETIQKILENKKYIENIEKKLPSRPMDREQNYFLGWPRWSAAYVSMGCLSETSCAPVSAARPEAPPRPTPPHPTPPRRHRPRGSHPGEGGQAAGVQKARQGALGFEWISTAKRPCGKEVVNANS